MQYTFEVTVTGCDTKCAHCYVGGGPGKNMSLNDYRRCAEKMAPVLDRIAEAGGDCAWMLGNEKYHHPQILELLRVSGELLPEYSSMTEDFDNPTTGISLMGRRDREEIFTFLKEHGCDRFMLTLHGMEEHHNQIVGNRLGFSALDSLSDLLRERGFSVQYNLMLSRTVVEDWDGLRQHLCRKNADRVFLTIPLYVPTPRLRRFQKYRAQLSQCRELLGRMDGLGIDEERYRGRIESGSEEQLLRLTEYGWNFAERDRTQPQWVFFNIDGDCNLYYGNAGLHTKCLGNIKAMGVEELADCILGQPPNYDDTAYYDLNHLPDIQAVRKTAREAGTNYVYSDPESCIYRWLDLCGVPTRLMGNAAETG